MFGIKVSARPGAALRFLGGARLAGVVGPNPTFLRYIGSVLPSLARGLNDLYVALTRATQRLGVIHTGVLPAALDKLEPVDMRREHGPTSRGCA
jgi:hypothetical protein